MSDRLFHLTQLYQKLDDRLRQAQKRRWIDPFEVMRLKKLKLRIKDRLVRMVRRPVAQG